MSNLQEEMAQRKALVVGGSGGMGNAISVALAQEGIESALIGRNKEALAATEGLY